MLLVLENIDEATSMWGDLLLNTRTWQETFLKFVRRFKLKNSGSCILISSETQEDWLDWGVGSRIPRRYPIKSPQVEELEKYVANILEGSAVDRFADETSRYFLSKILRHYEGHPVALREVTKCLKSSELSTEEFFERILIQPLEIDWNAPE